MVGRLDRESRERTRKDGARPPCYSAVMSPGDIIIYTWARFERRRII